VEKSRPICGKNREKGGKTNRDTRITNFGDGDEQARAKKNVEKPYWPGKLDADRGGMEPAMEPKQTLNQAWMNASVNKHTGRGERGDNKRKSKPAKETQFSRRLPTKKKKEKKSRYQLVKHA